MSKKFIFGIFGIALLGAVLTSSNTVQAQVCGDCKTVSSAGLCMGKPVNSSCGKERYCINLGASGCPLGISACGCSSLSGATPQPRQTKPVGSGNTPGNQPIVTPTGKNRIP